MPHVASRGCAKVLLSLRSRDFGELRLFKQGQVFQVFWTILDYFVSGQLLGDFAFLD